MNIIASFSLFSILFSLFTAAQFFERGISIKPVDLTAEESYNANAPMGGHEGVDFVGAFLRPHN